MAPMSENKPQIAYPTHWKYKVILDCEVQKKGKIDEILQGENYESKFSKFSNGGKYMSFYVAVLVASDTHRIEVFERLKQNFKFVL